MRLLQPSLSKRYGKGSWALVTGASDGIGKGFCFELAAEQFNIILIGRNLKKLQDVEQELHQQFSNKNKTQNNNKIEGFLEQQFQTQIVVVDFKNSINNNNNNINVSDFFQQQIVDKVKDKDISILINNVGVDALKPFEELTEIEISDLIAVNILPQAFLTKKLIGQLNSRKYKSAIVNVSSLTAVRPQPFFNVYGATKAFNYFFSKSLASEYSDKNVDILCLKPGFVTSQLTMQKKSGFDTLSPRECARGALNHLRFESMTYGNWRHKFFGFTLQHIDYILPDSIFNFILKKIVLKKEMKRRADASKIH